MRFSLKVFWVAMPCSISIGKHCFRGPCSLHLQGGVNGTGKKGIDIGMVYMRGIESGSQQEARRGGLTASRMWERIVTLAVGGEQDGVSDWLLQVPRSSVLGEGNGGWMVVYRSARWCARQGSTCSPC